MAVKLTIDEVDCKISAEKSPTNKIVVFKPRIILELEQTGKLWTTKVKRNDARG
jgi:hypothetical protein